MKLVSLSLNAQPPIKAFAVDNLADVVVIAGPNGVGKTNVLNFLLGAFRNPGGSPGISLTVEATTPAETAAWGGRTRLNASVAEEANLLRQSLQRGQKRGQLRGGVLNFDAARVFENIQPYQFTWDSSDPFEEHQGWDYTFNSARTRFQDVVWALYRKVRSQREEIAEKAIELQKGGSKEMPLGFPDPIQKFKDAFGKLLPGKTLCELDIRSQQLMFTTADNVRLPFDRLSSGEKEVVTVVFDFLLRDPQDSIVVFDEPELHLHPELSYRLLRTLRESGERNQFIFCTHSPDIISASLDQSVIFVSPPKPDGGNQAVTVCEEDDAARVLHLLGHSVGVISLGRRIVLIEGTHASIDKQTYGSILGNSANDLVLVPTGSKDTIKAFLSALGTVLHKTIWGVEFFMLCDGDSVVDDSAAALKAHPHFRQLGRYHLENYFLDEVVLARVFAAFGEPDGSWLRDPVAIAAALKDIAKTRLSYAAALRVSHGARTEVGNVDLMPEGCHELDLIALQAAFEKRAEVEKTRVMSAVDTAKLKAFVEKEYNRIGDALSSGGDTWKKWIPGKQVLAMFASKAKVDLARLKTAYIREAKTATDPFSEVRDVFSYFASYTDNGS
jgi:energy-coupling factor transporter ATP-binding protein EcfA2